MDPSSSYILDSRSDLSFIAAYQNFYTTCQSNAATLGLTAANLTEIQGGLTTLQTAYNNMIAQRDLAKNTTTTKITARKNAHTIVAKWAKTFDANPAISDGLLNQLQLPPHKPGRTISAPTTPTNLVAEANGNGLIQLKWDRNGNTSATIFEIEAQYAPGGDWTQIGSTTKTRYQFPATIGNYISLRLYSSRNDRVSQPTTPVTLWGNGASGAEPVLKVA